jgi:hypothetical protein
MSGEGRTESAIRRPTALMQQATHGHTLVLRATKSAPHPLSGHLLPARGEKGAGMLSIATGSLHIQPPAVMH